jgi:hypothetical protein
VRDLVEAGGLEPLVAILAGTGISGMGLGLDSESCQEQKLNACLALGNLSMASTVTIDDDDDIYKYEDKISSPTWSSLATNSRFHLDRFGLISAT